MRLCDCEQRTEECGMETGRSSRNCSRLSARKLLWHNHFVLRNLIPRAILLSAKADIGSIFSAPKNPALFGSARNILCIYSIIVYR